MALQIGIEETVTRAVKSIGGRVVSELFPSRGNRPKNADFVFDEHRVIAELKRLEKDQSEDPNVTAKLNEMYRRWVAQGKRVPIIFGRGQLNLRNIPVECANEVISLLREPIARRIRKANEQIKATKSALGMQDARGLLLLAQDGDYSLGPEAVFNLASRCLKGGQFRAIDDIIHFNANLPASRSEDSLGYMFWFHASRDPERAIPSRLIQSLSEAWQTQLEFSLGSSMISTQEPPEIDSLGFRKTHNRFNPPP